MARKGVVVGAGVMGSATAWSLARRGVETVVLERFAAGHDRGSSHGASRIFRLAYEDALYARVARVALDGWRALEEESGDHLLTRTGGFDHGHREPLDAIASALRAIDAPFEFLTAGDARNRWPGLRIDGETVLHQPDAGVLNADAAVASLQRCAASRGAAFNFETAALAVRETSGAVIVETDGDTLEADVAILTAGAWLPRLAAGLATFPPLRVTQEQPAYFAPRDPGMGWPVFIHRFDPGRPDLVELLAAYGLPTPGHGVKVGEHGRGPAVDPNQRTEPDPAGLARLSRYVEAWVPGLDPEPRETISCLYTSTTDEHFVLGRVGRVVVASPCSGHGFKFAPALGDLIAGVAMGDAEVPSRWATVRSPEPADS